MQFLKLNFILLLALNSYANNQSRFSSKECLSADYETTIKSEGKFFGLIKNDLFVKKSKCDIEVKHKGILESVWNIDLCREPIHMKVTSKGSQNVFKKEGECKDDSTSDFCYYLKELKTNISDYGLIFAKGLREKLSDPHGQIYCTSLLLDKYFDDSVVFSLFDKTVNLYSEKKEVCVLPSKEEKSEKVSEESESQQTPQIGSSEPKSSTEEEKAKF